MIKKLMLIIAVLAAAYAGWANPAGGETYLTCDPQQGVTYYQFTWTSAEPDKVEISEADESGAANHDVSWLPVGVHKGYVQAGKEWKIREGAAPDQLGEWVAQAAYTWSAPTYFEIDGGTPQPASNVTAMEIR